MVEDSGDDMPTITRRIVRKSLTVRRISPSNGGKKESKKRSLTLLDSDILDCPICCEALSVPIFQCDNGHLACSSCCPKLNDKCPSCASQIGHIRCRAMEIILESISSPCPNAKLGCTKNVSYGKESSHVKECNFSPCSCPVEGCNYTGSYIDLYNHCDSAVHLREDTIRYTPKFQCGVPYGSHMFIREKISIFRESGMRLLFVMQCFREPSGVYVTISCIAPSIPEVGEFSYHLTYTADAHTLTYQSPKMKSILEVSYETPHENFMLLPNCFLRGDMVRMKILIKKFNQE